MPKPGIEDHVDAHTAARAALITTVVRTATDIVRTFNGWYSTPEITKMAASVVVQVEAAQRATAAVTDAYLSAVASEMAGKRVRPVGTVKVDGLRAGITHAGVYGRLADQYRWRISQDVAPDLALEAVVQRAAVVVETDTDLAFRAQVNRFMVERNATGYRRVIRPERSAHGSCGLCIVASDRIYKRADLLPLHGRCKCSVLPIIADNDPGHRLNTDDLRALYKAAGGTDASKLAKTRVTVRQNGEIGPVLTRSGDTFRDARQVARDTRKANHDSA